MSGQMNIQFHAKKREIFDFVRDVIDENNIKAYGIVLFPDYKAEEITNFDDAKVFEYRFIILCHSEPEIGSCEQYYEYLKQENGDLVISLGTDDGAELVESAMGVVYNDHIDMLWKRIINKFKKVLIRGAYVVTPDGKSGYYPKHGYTIGAQEAYEKGVAIKPIAGWNYYMLQKE